MQYNLTKELKNTNIEIIYHQKHLLLQLSKGHFILLLDEDGMVTIKR
jgi:hypothetical protein